MSMESPPTPDTIQAALQSLTLDNTAPPPTSAVTTLATASRSQPQVRTQLADPRVLKTLVELVEISLHETLETTCLALRCIGNACIDNDAAREYISTSLGFGWALQCLRHDEEQAGVRSLTVKVLYNVCSGHESAQRGCYQAGVHYALWALRNGSTIAEGETHENGEGGAGDGVLMFLADLLLWITGHKAVLEPSLSKDSVSDDAIVDALLLPSEVKFQADGDEFAALVEAALSLLKDAAVQGQILEQKRLQNVLDLVYATEQKLSAEEDPDQIKILGACWTNLLWCLSDLAANPVMAEKYALDCVELNAMVNGLVQYSQGARIHPRLPTAACQVIGNILWNLAPENYASFVERPLDDVTRLDTALFQAVADKEDIEFLHAASGLLVQLSRPSVAIRERIGTDRNTGSALRRLCRHEKPELKKDGIQLLRALGKDCPANQERFGELAVEAMGSLNTADAISDGST